MKRAPDWQPWTTEAAMVADFCAWVDVGLVADRLGMECTLIELNEESADIAQRRIKAALGSCEGAPESVEWGADSLFAGAA